MKGARVVLAVIALHASLCVMAAVGDTYGIEVNGITWVYTEFKEWWNFGYVHRVSIGGYTTGNRPVTALPTTTSGAVKIPNTLNGNDVVAIKAFAFTGCDLLTSVEIPYNLRSVAGGTFGSCSGLMSINAGTNHPKYKSINGLLLSKDGLTLVAVPGGLTSVTIPDGVTSIGDSAFYNCSGLTSVTIPNSVTSIGDYVFRNCRGLTDVAIPGSVTNIGLGAFYDCRGLMNVTIPSGVTSIGDDAFHNCSNLASVTMPFSLTYIGNDAFSGCSGLTSVTIPNGVKSIGYDAFYGCSGLTSVTIPNGVTNISYRAFMNCSALTNVVFEGNAPSVASDTFSGVSQECRGIISRSTFGWGTPISRRWNGLLITYPWYRFEFDAVGGSCVEEIRIVNQGCALGDLPIPERTGYEFLGWYTDDDGGDCIQGNSVVMTDTRLYAHWTPCKYLITFDANVGIGGTSENMAYESAIIVPTVTRMGYTLIGWSPSVAATVPLGGATYTAQWEINQYTVIFDANGGIGSTSGSQDYDTAIVSPTVTRTGYTFAGWTPSVAAAVPASNVTYTAQWTPNKFTVTFDANGGTGGWSRNLDYDLAIDAPIVTRTGYAFTGWSPSVPATVPLGDATYAAQWEIKQYAVTFDANGGTGGTSSSQDYGTAIVAPTVTRTGYTFKGWSPIVVATVPANDVTYTAQWEINKYAVTFDANGGEGGTSGSQDYGTAIVAPTVTRTGYTFKGWSPNVVATVPANDVAYTAQWEINQYAVIFDANGGVGGTSSSQNYGTAIVAPTVTRTGYTFKGWSPNVAATVPANDVTYTAQWEINKYAVTFDANGGEGGTSGSQDYGTAIVAPTVTRTGYTFKGWSPAVAATVPANDVTYRAQWEINKYTVTFNANGGTGGTSGSQNYGTAITPPTVARTGYTFAGWSPGVAATVPANDVTYTAQWTPNAYAVTFDANGGIGGWSRNLDYDSAIVAPTVTRTGYTFKGWSPSVPTTVPLGGATYTAQWQINQYTVTFNANGGVGGKSTKQDYGTAIVTPTVTRTGYTFKGWSPSVMATVPAYNVTYTAQWEINKYTVTFDANGGTCETEAATVEHGAALGILPVPTRTQAVFLGWFTESGVRVDELTTVTCAVTLYAHWLTEVANPVVTTDWGTLVFRTNSCVVSISCATEGASIYYTDDGTTPKKNDNYFYAGPFTITDTTTIKAVAVIGDVQSEYVTVTITKKLLSLEEALDVDDVVSVATNANLPWLPIFDANAKVGDATARSGAIGDRTNTWLSATVSGAGTMSFWCKVSCEHDDDNTFTWDRLMVYTNDIEVVEWRMDGETDWTRREVSFAGGENTVKWVYFKDRSISEGEDCAWVDGVTWTPADVAVDVGGGKSVLVPMDWIDAHSNIVTAVGGDKSAAMKSTAANGRKVWECYVLGLDPEKTGDFKITSFPMKADGTPDLSAITFEPEQKRWNLSGATPKLKGKATLDAEWQDVPPGGNPSFRFFTMEVQMP